MSWKEELLVAAGIWERWEQLYNTLGPWDWEQHYNNLENMGGTCVGAEVQFYRRYQDTQVRESGKGIGNEDGV